MGVKVLPYFKLFRGAEGKVAEFSCTVSKIQKIRVRKRFIWVCRTIYPILYKVKTFSHLPHWAGCHC